MPQSIATKRVNKKRTICEVHREIHDIWQDHYRDAQHFAAIVALLQEAYTMAKKMNEKLKQYKYNYDDEWWEKTSRAIVKEKLERRTSRSK